MNKSIFKSIGAVLAGFIAVVVLSVATDFALEALGIFPPPGQGLFIAWMLMLALIYRSIYAVAGGYVTAMVAPNRPMRHAIILGIIGLVVSIFGAIVAWDRSAHWYPLALIITALPCTWLGGKLKTKRPTKKREEI